MALFGTSAFLAILAPEQLAEQLVERLRSILVVAAGLAAATTATAPAENRRDR